MKNILNNTIHVQYTKFSLISLVKSKLILLFSLITFITGIIYMSVMLSVEPNMNKWNNYEIFTLPFVFITLTAALLATATFSDQKRDGYEMYVHTFSIKRRVIFTSKIISIIFYLLIYQFIWFSIYSILFSAFANNTNNYSLIISSSLAFGGLIIQLLFVQVVALISIFGRKSIALLVSITISLLLPLSSLFAARYLNGSPRDINALNEPLYVSSLNINSQKDLDNSNNNQYYMDNYSTDVIKRLNKFNNDSDYNKFSLFDMWYHSNNILNIFDDSKKFNSGILQQWEIGKDKIAARSFLTGKDKYIGFAKKDDIKLDFKKDIIVPATNVINYLKRDNEALATFNNESNLSQRLLFTQMIMSQGDTNNINPIIKNILLESNKNTASINTLLNIKPQAVYVYKQITKNKELNITAPKNEIKNFNYGVEPVGQFFIPGSYIDIPKPSKYQSIYISMLIFLGISVILTTLTYYFYSKKVVE